MSDNHMYCGYSPGVNSDASDAGVDVIASVAGDTTDTSVSSDACCEVHA